MAEALRSGRRTRSATAGVALQGPGGVAQSRLIAGGRIATARPQPGVARVAPQEQQQRRQQGDEDGHQPGPILSMVTGRILAQPPVRSRCVSVICTVSRNEEVSESDESPKLVDPRSPIAPSWTKQDASRAVDALLATREDALRRGRRGCGPPASASSHVSERGGSAGWGVNPRTGERIQIGRIARLPRFTAGSGLKSAVRGR